jgi:poly(3-hydroxybutyrate) depolymerase
MLPAAQRTEKESDMATGCVPAFEEIAFADSMTAWSAAADGVAEWWASAIRRQASPPQLMLESMSWWAEVVNRRPPTWSSPNKILLETPVARLRDFSGRSRAQVVPTLVLPPQAGHDSCIVDYSAEQSQMRTIIGAGLTRAYSLDWMGATDASKDAGIDDYLQVIDQSVDRLGGTVNLVGDCQGGWLATIYAALAPERVNTLTIAGAPIDFHAGDPVIIAALRSLAPNGNLDFYRGLVAAGNGTLQGKHMLAGFIMIQPDNEVGRQYALLANINDPAHVERYREFEDWFKYTQPIPGAFYLWIVEHLFRDNELIAGTLKIGDQRVDLSRIACPLNLLAGNTDHITPAAQVYALADHASTEEPDVLRERTAGGHLGLFMGHEALHHHWPKLLAAVLERSR